MNHHALSAYRTYSVDSNSSPSKILFRLQPTAETPKQSRRNNIYGGEGGSRTRVYRTYCQFHTMIIKAPATRYSFAHRLGTGSGVIESVRKL